MVIINDLRFMRLYVARLSQGSPVCGAQDEHKTVDIYIIQLPQSIVAFDTKPLMQHLREKSRVSRESLCLKMRENVLSESVVRY